MAEGAKAGKGPGIRATALVVAALGMAAPAALLLLPALSPLPALAAAAVALACLLFLARYLAPLDRLGADLIARGLIAPPRCTPAGLARAIADLAARAAPHRHRWSDRHPLTGLPIREALLAAISEDLAAGPPPMLLGAVRFADHGRLAAFDPDQAEAALKAFADRLQASVGKARPIAHVDRDSFAIWFRGADRDSAAAELNALCYALGAEIAIGDSRIVPEVEAGAAAYPDDGASPAALVNRALVSLARPGADGAAVVRPGRAASAARERFTLEQDLRRAIERDQFVLHFQPVVDLRRGALVGAEALLRWEHPEAGTVSPSRFVPILEDSSLIGDIGLWTLNAACREARGWQRRGLGPLRVAVNLSPAQLRDPGLGRSIVRTLARHGLAPSALELELTETAAMEDEARSAALFAELRALGVGLSIDDFGSGYSSLGQLKSLPFDKLKIDREFVADVHVRRDSRAICASLVALADGLGLTLLAEGVERAEEMEALRALGCHIFQGYHFSRPLAPGAFLRLVSDPEWRARLARAAAGPTGLHDRMTA